MTISLADIGVVALILERAARSVMELRAHKNGSSGSRAPEYWELKFRDIIRDELREQRDHLKEMLEK